MFICFKVILAEDFGQLILVLGFKEGGIRIGLEECLVDGFIILYLCFLGVRLYPLLGLYIFLDVVVTVFECIAGSFQVLFAYQLFYVFIIWELFHQSIITFMLDFIFGL